LDGQRYLVLKFSGQKLNRGKSWTIKNELFPFLSSLTLAKTSVDLGVFDLCALQDLADEPG
jgi:hypothetical protein